MTDLTYRTVNLSGDSYHVLTGPAGTVTWPTEKRRNGRPLTFHSTTPRWDGQERAACVFVEGGCYLSDRYPDYTNPLVRADAAQDPAAIEAELTKWYTAQLVENDFVPVDIDAATGYDHTPARLSGEECTRVLKAIHGEDKTLHDAVRAAYRARRIRFLNLATATPDVYPEPLRWEAEADLIREHVPHLDPEQAHVLFHQVRAQSEAGDEAGVQATLDTLTGVRG
jgi:hypothetical protein